MPIERGSCRFNLRKTSEGKARNWDGDVP